MTRLLKHLQRFVLFLFIANFAFAVLIILYRTLPTNNRSSYRSESEARWIATSHSWLDRTACRWINICGATNWLGQTWLFKRPSTTWRPELGWELDWQRIAPPVDWLDGHDPKPEEWSEDERYRRDIPKCIIDNAPLIFLHPDEPYWIADPAKHVYDRHTRAKFHGEEINATSLSLKNLASLNSWGGGGEDICLTSRNNINDNPPWMIANWTIPKPYPIPQIPTSPGMAHYFYEDPNIVAKREGWYEASPIPLPEKPPPDFRYTNWTAIRPEPHWEPDGSELPGWSPAPAVLIIVHKANNTIDAFWFVFNSFNLGNRVLGMEFGNHVGDWEHVMIRFQNCQPKALYTSRHSFGDAAYAWDALETVRGRPVVYSARGSHAMYVTEGVQPYKLPFNMLHDTTARGPLWDPALVGLKAYTYDILGTGNKLRASSISPRAVTNWFYFNGNWGDERYPLNDSRQYRFAGEYHYATGPKGPKFKNLERSMICESKQGDCLIRNILS